MYAKSKKLTRGFDHVSRPIANMGRSTGIFATPASSAEPAVRCPVLFTVSLGTEVTPVTLMIMRTRMQYHWQRRRRGFREWRSDAQVKDACSTLKRMAGVTTCIAPGANRLGVGGL